MRGVIPAYAKDVAHSRWQLFPPVGEGQEGHPGKDKLAGFPAGKMIALHTRGSDIYVISDF